MDKDILYIKTIIPPTGGVVHIHDIHLSFFPLLSYRIHGKYTSVFKVCKTNFYAKIATQIY
ncbi:MAG: hypothetical protein QW103_02955 [Candidatus Pacearchaeota archaeon]